MDIAAWTLIALLVTLWVVHRTWLRAVWFRLEDPRTVAVFRIATGSLLLAWLVDLAPLYDYLFSDAGLMTGEEARARFGRGQRWSLLYEYGSPTFVRGYVWVMGAACLAFTVGLATPVTKWITLALLHGLVTRNAIYLGGEQVFTSFLFYLCLSRCGEAYGFDAWRRRRRSPQTLALRAIPAWPRMLMLLQLLAVLCVNGLAKYGDMWRRGDMVYYLFNHPHFGPNLLPSTRWEVSALLGTNLFRWMTWVGHGFEVLFPLALVGVVLRVAATSPLPKLSGGARWVSRGIRVMLGSNIVVLATLRFPPQTRGHLPFVAVVFAGVLIAIGPALLGVARRIPPRLLAFATGRLLWGTLLFVFGFQLFVVFEIGWFTGLTMSTAILFVDGKEIGRVMAWARGVGVRALAPRGLRAGPQEAPQQVDASEPVASSSDSPFRRRAVAVLCGLHIIAVAAAQLPGDKVMPAWRKTIEQPLDLWLDWTTGFQVWRMFAPNGSRHIFDVEAVLVDTAGREHSLGPGIVDPELRSSAWGRDKREKIRRRLGGRGQRYRVWHAQWLCRRFAHTVPGDVAVRIYAIRMTMPAPQQLSDDIASALQQHDASLRRWVKYEVSCPST